LAASGQFLVAAVTRMPLPHIADLRPVNTMGRHRTLAAHEDALWRRKRLLPHICTP